MTCWFCFCFSIYFAEGLSILISHQNIVKNISSLQTRKCKNNLCRERFLLNIRSSFVIRLLAHKKTEEM